MKALNGWGSVLVAGGFRVSEPAADLGVALSIASSLYNHALEPGVVALGEVGLSGELRNVPQAERRLMEASRLGMTRAILPELAKGDFTHSLNIELVYARTLKQALREALGAPRVERGQFQSPDAPYLELQEA